MRRLILVCGMAGCLVSAAIVHAQESSNQPPLEVNSPADESIPDAAPSTAATATNTPVVSSPPAAVAPAPAPPAPVAPAAPAAPPAVVPSVPPPAVPAPSPAVETNPVVTPAPAIEQPVSVSPEPAVATPAVSVPSPALSSGTETNVHLLVPDDLVEIKVYQQPDLETKARIDRDGTVTMPLLGSVRISGKTDEQARALIHDLLAKDYLVNPQVSVTVVEYAKRSFTILGEVQRPGTYEIPSGESVTLLQAIAFAGGYTRIGSPSKVIVQRIEDGQKKIYNLDAGAMARDERVKPFEVLPNDSITVGEKFF